MNGILPTFTERENEIYKAQAEQPELICWASSGPMVISPFLRMHFNAFAMTTVSEMYFKFEISAPWSNP